MFIKPTVARKIGGVVLAACMSAGLAACQSTPDRPMTSSNERTGSHAMDDSALTNAVKAKLVAEGTPSLKRVNVTTDGGTVHLSGTVDTDEQKEQASRLAGQVQGVQRVDNTLRVSRSEAAGQPDKVIQ